MAPATEAARPLTADGLGATLLANSCDPLAAPLETGVEGMTELPSGTVTFLLTDVEGSTARWEGHPEAMRVALARHDALVRAAIVDHGGHVVKTMGDGFHAAFSHAHDAVAAAIDAQRRLQAEPWGRSACDPSARSTTCPARGGTRSPIPRSALLGC
jgi:class 3 adenylate cyclase